MRKTDWLTTVLTGLCIALVLLFGTVQATHTHSDLEAHADCSLCVVSHGSVQVVAAPVIQTDVQIIEPIETEPTLSGYSAPIPFHLSSRPPPVAVFFA